MSLQLHVDEQNLSSISRMSVADQLAYRRENIHHDSLHWQKEYVGIMSLLVVPRYILWSLKRWFAA